MRRPRKRATGSVSSSWSASRWFSPPSSTRIARMRATCDW